MVFITIYYTMLLLSCTAEGAWDLLSKQNEILQSLSGYDHRIKITMDNSSQDEAFSNFPVLVRLNPGRITYSDISADGSGIKFISSDYTEEFSYEVEEWNSGGESFFWVKIPSISALSDSEYFWIYYSTDNNTDTTNSSDVWSNSYLAVWHMNDTGNPIKDSTSSGLDGTVDFMGGPGPVAGNIGGAQNFNNDSAKVTINSAAVLDDLGPVTFSFWMLEEDYSDQDIILKKGGLEIRLLSNNTIYYYVDYDGGSGNDLERAYDNSWTKDVWRSFFLTWTGAAISNKIVIFTDGVVAANLTIQSNGGGTRVSDAGNDLIIGNDSLNNRSFEGQLDEIRISSVVRSPAWISAQYLSMTDSFLTYGPEKDISN